MVAVRIYRISHCPSSWTRRCMTKIRSVQFLAAASELAIPHYTSATVFAVAKQGNADVFYRNVKLLAVRP